MNLTVNQHQPSVKEFNKLRAKVGWQVTDPETTQKSLDSSLFHVCVLSDEQSLIGMARVISDGAMYFYIQDVIVDPAFQQKGIGAMLMEEIEGFLTTAAVKGATIGLLAAQGKEQFYEKYGYIGRNGENLGLGMCKFI